MPHGRFIWYELMTTDVAAAEAFYAQVIGWGTQDAPLPGPGYHLMTAENTPVVGLMNLPDDAQSANAKPQWVGYVNVDDVDTAVDKTERLGGTVHVPPRDIPGISRFAIIADPQGAALALIKGMRPEEARPPANAGAPGRIGWHELLAADWEKAFFFYGALFGWQKADAHVSATGAYQQFAAGSETIGGMFSQKVSPPFWLYYANVDDLGAASKRVLAAGGEILYGPAEVPGGSWILHCRDPQGAIFALLDRRRRKAVGYFVAGGSPPNPDTPKL